MSTSTTSPGRSIRGTDAIEEENERNSRALVVVKKNKRINAERRNNAHALAAYRASNRNYRSSGVELSPRKRDDEIESPKKIRKPKKRDDETVDSPQKLRRQTSYRSVCYPDNDLPERSTALASFSPESPMTKTSKTKKNMKLSSAPVVSQFDKLKPSNFQRTMSFGESMTVVSGKPGSNNVKNKGILGFVTVSSPSHKNKTLMTLSPGRIERVKSYRKKISDTKKSVTQSKQKNDIQEGSHDTSMLSPYAMNGRVGSTSSRKVRNERQGSVNGRILLHKKRQQKLSEPLPSSPPKIVRSRSSIQRTPKSPGRMERLQSFNNNSRNNSKCVASPPKEKKLQEKRDEIEEGKVVSRRILSPGRMERVQSYRRKLLRNLNSAGNELVDLTRTKEEEKRDGPPLEEHEKHDNVDQFHTAVDCQRSSGRTECDESIESQQINVSEDESATQETDQKTESGNNPDSSSVLSLRRNPSIGSRNMSGISLSPERMTWKQDYKNKHTKNIAHEEDDPEVKSNHGFFPTVNLFPAVTSFDGQAIINRSNEIVTIPNSPNRKMRRKSSYGYSTQSNVSSPNNRYRKSVSPHREKESSKEVNATRSRKIEKNDAESFIGTLDSVSNLPSTITNYLDDYGSSLDDLSDNSSVSSRSSATQLDLFENVLYSLQRAAEKVVIHF